MKFGQTIGEACATFAATNIDNIFVLVTFFTEASMGNGLTPLQITVGQYAGFTIIIAISMIGYGVSFLFTPEPIGFLGLLPILLGCWRLLSIIVPSREMDEDYDTAIGGVTDAARRSKIIKTWLKSICKVASVTIMNGGDNISTYVPLFSRAKGAQIAIYIVIYYMLLGLWCLAAFIIIKQKHILRVAQKYARIVVPFLYIGLGIYILIESDCYPWSIEQINNDISSHPGTIVLAVTTTGLLLLCLGWMLWTKWQRRATPQMVDTEDAGRLEHKVPQPEDMELAVPEARHSIEAVQPQTGYLSKEKELGEAPLEKMIDSTGNEQTKTSG